MPTSTFNLDTPEQEAARRKRVQDVLNSYDTQAARTQADTFAAAPKSVGMGDAYTSITKPASDTFKGWLNATAGKWNDYNTGRDQLDQAYLNAIANAGNERIWYYNVKLAQEAAANAARNRGGGGGGRRGGGGGGGRRRGGGGGGAAGGMVAPAGSYDDWLAGLIGSLIGPSSAPPSYTAPARTPTLGGTTPSRSKSYPSRAASLAAKSYPSRAGSLAARGR